MKVLILVQLTTGSTGVLQLPFSGMEGTLRTLCSRLPLVYECIACVLLQWLHCLLFVWGADHDLAPRRWQHSSTCGRAVAAHLVAASCLAW
jgi:hypothetical protein